MVIMGKQYNEKTLEKCLPSYLEKDLQNLKEGIKNHVSYIDCLIDEDRLKNPNYIFG